MTGNEIPDADDIYRWIQHHHVSKDEPQAVYSNAFYKSENKKSWPDPHCSVDWSQLGDAEACLAFSDWAGTGVAVLQASAPRRLELKVVHDPIESDHHGRPRPSHALILGLENSSVGKQHCRAMAKKTRVVIPPVRQDLGEQTE